MRRLKSFLDWYAYYRRSQIIVSGLGRWESFWRALGWTIEGKK